MSPRNDINRLQELADLIFDRRLAVFRAAAGRRAQSMSQIAALDRSAPATDLPFVAEGLVELRYQAWADARREDLNTILSRQTADWLAARDDARLAFGRAQALRGLAARGTLKD